MKAFKTTGLAYLWLTVIFLVLDQVTKQLIAQNFYLGESVNLLPFFDLTYARNYGAAFSFLADQGGWQRWFFTFIAIAASILFVYWLAKEDKSNTRLNVAFSMMLSGALGNLIDRLIFGYVIDFLDFYWGSYHWPAFNVADSAIFIGAAFMILDAFLSNDDSKTTAGEKS